VNQRLYLLCGVPGSGKTWVMNQVRTLYNAVDHDDFIGQDLVQAVLQRASSGELDKRPMLVDCPFAERELRGRLERAGFSVVPIFIVEPTHVVQDRYMKREGKPLPRPSVTRAATILQRVHEWNAPRGTSEQVLDWLLKEVA
jgi:hypothetical protein